MDFEEAVRYMSGLIRFGWKLGNERMEALCERLGNPQQRYAVVHVAGTKGKGSTTALAAAILRAQGYRTGAYYSPYVYDVRERVQVNGAMISKEDFARLATKIRPHIEALAETKHGQTTEFELKTALGFLYFAEQQVDFACIEVGIGGRLDATNVVNPAVCVITNIGLDHTDILGDTYAKIAAEKAGIIKPGIPCITAAHQQEALRTIVRIAGERDAPLTYVAFTEVNGVAALRDCVQWWFESEGAGIGDRIASDEGRRSENGALSQAELYDHTPANTNPEPPNSAVPHSPDPRNLNPASLSFDFAPVTIATPAQIYPDMPMRMGGLYQRENAACAVAAVETALAARGEVLTQQAAAEGLATTALPGRLTVLRLTGGPLVVLDGAHNGLAAHALAGPVHALQSLEQCERTVLVIGMVGGHDPEEVLAELAPGVETVFACQPQWKRAHPAQGIAEAAAKYVADVRAFDTVAGAVQAALRVADTRTLILITGSFYTVGEASPTQIEAWQQESREAQNEQGSHKVSNVKPAAEK